MLDASHPSIKLGRTPNPPRSDGTTRSPARFFDEGGVIFVYARDLSWTWMDALRLQEETVRMAPEERWVGVEDVAAHLQVAKKSIYR